MYFLPGYGEQNYPLALSSAMHLYVIDPLATPTEKRLDDKVFQGYGAKLFPRAIGYSTGLIDYFVRGLIDGNAPYGGTPLNGPSAEFPLGQPPTQVTVEGLTNYTVGEDTTGNSSVYLVLKFLSKQNTTEVFPEMYVSNPSSLGVTNTPRTFMFDFITPLPFPSTLSGETTYIAYLVYKGRLGSENDAVVVGGMCGAPYFGIEFRHLQHFPPPFGTGEEYLNTRSGCDA